jgi:two-component system sensor histidine kinase ChiS
VIAALLRSPLLVVDDDGPTRDALVDGLTDQGFEVYQADNGARALDLMIAIRPALVLLDLMMPGMTGWEVLEEMRTRPDLREIPVLVVTAARHIGRAPLGYQVWVKPVRMDSLTTAIRDLLR